MRPSAQSLSIDSEAMRARGIIDKYSRFIWPKGSITLTRAETERYDIVLFSEVTTKSLASGTGSKESNELGENKIAGELILCPGPRDFFWCENGLYAGLLSV